MIRILRPLLPLLLAALLGGVATPSLHAQEAPVSPPPAGDMPAPRPWSSLDSSQHEVLAPLQKTWDSMSPRKQSRMLQRAEHWVTLPPERREEIRQHITRWQQMTPDERRQARENMHKFHQLPPQQRERLHATFEHFQQLPPDQREKLIREWHALPPAERLHWDEHHGHDRPPPGAPGHP
ncbi:MULTISPECIES: DUF3106 domain-containing protein [Rhodanobacter]|uniref:DUF3106 domain-containing protein n=1 Tax=Rhodanobacter TaxID=75309 RepID=UPI000406C543|nr:MULTISPECIES: DUF3106 domain-containing protein [Rhodanobacter]TAN19146.1 MAG: DUF3106 domain-containing protein [Rhodanobacter sp.]UJJ55950.1 DUF3106 domain-containing protein [Rhodanobacter thiooxydans]